VRGLALESALRMDDPPAWEVIPKSPPTKRCYLRFACAELDPDSGRRTGVFSAAYELVWGDELDAAAADALQAELEWFEENVPAPHRFDRPEAVFLFKSETTGCTSHIWELVRLLREHGVQCQMQVFRDPGTIVFEDRYQVAVLPRSGPSLL